MSGGKTVILFCAALAGDGVARNTVRLASALAARGLAVEVVTLRGGMLAGELRGAALTCLGAPRLPRGVALAAAIPHLRRRLAETRPDLVVSMGNHGHLALWAALRGLDDLPRVYRISNDPSHGGEPLARRWLRELGLRLIAADATRLIAVSAAIARGDLFRRARRDRRLHVAPNGVDLADVRARAASPLQHPWLEDGRPYVLAAGRLHRQKNYGTLLEALALAHRLGRPDLRLLILGGGSRAAQAALRSRAEDLGIGAAVRLEGEVDNPFPLMSRASVYVLPSLWEGASNSLLEALACGTPTVASRNAGSAPEVLAYGRYGVLAEASDPADLARAILRQACPETRATPGHRAEDFALQPALAVACDAILASLSDHDGNQFSAERRGQPRAVGDRLRGANEEY